MALPANYRPREGDKVLIRAVVRFDCDVGEDEAHLKIVGSEHNTPILKLDKIHSVVSRAWVVGDLVKTQDGDITLGCIQGVVGEWVWIEVRKSHEPTLVGKMYTYSAMEIDNVPPEPVVGLPSSPIEDSFARATELESMESAVTEKPDPMPL